MIGCGCLAEGSAKLVAEGNAVARYIGLGGDIMICGGMALGGGIAMDGSMRLVEALEAGGVLMIDAMG